MQRINFDTPFEMPPIGAMNGAMNRAIVIGASMAGLLAARVLSERFAQVLVLERDELPYEPALRKGTPQVSHAHALLSRGRQIIEELFPGFTDSLCERGAQVYDGVLGVHLLIGGRPLARAATGERGIVGSRLLIEDEVRNRVRALANVQLMTRIDVMECIFDPVHDRLTGVRIRMRDAMQLPPEDGVLAADLVVDCSGRGSRAPQWLRNWGFVAPDEEQVTIGVGYATAYFERSDAQFPDCGAVISQATAEMTCPAVMIAQEPALGDSRPRWVVTFGGFSGDHPEPTLDGLRRRSLQSGSDLIARVVHESKLISEVTRYGFPHSQRRRYERLRRFPERFLVMGDAIASFNPIYGQGMTVAACEAIALRSALAQGLDRLHKRYFRAAAKAVDTPWQIAVGADLTIPTVGGERTFGKRIINAYMRCVFRAAEQDPAVTIAFRNVSQMLTPPASLFRPGIVARVLWRNLHKAPSENRAQATKPRSALAGTR
jgi:2-polyprenyl-6-methoxyphenol hydroxylase-like FAD-dependent oxidoreductase